MIKIQINKNLEDVKLEASSINDITTKYLTGGKLEFFNNIGDVTSDLNFQNQYIAGLHYAFANHNQFILNPNDIWLLILQGLSIHINENSEKFRDGLVDFSGKKDIVIIHDELVMGSDNNTWNILFPMFEKEISKLIRDPKIAENIVLNLSNSTDIDQTCFRIALMDIVKSYFSFVVRTRCGIPNILIDGERNDWVKIIEAIDYLLPKFELNDWSEKLKIIINNIILAYDGQSDVSFFDNIYKFQSMSGGDIVNGWINDFFPYVIANNKIIKKTDTKNYMNTSEFTSSIASVPFLWEYFGLKYNMNFHAGFCGFKNEENSIKIVKNFFISHVK